MFKSEAELFLSANNNINHAKTLINECKRIVGEMELQGNSDYTNCKNNILNCDIDSLVDLVETTKESLFKLDQSFASEYMTLIQEYIQTDGLDTSQMTEEELLAYSIQMSGYERDYNYGLLYTLEKYEESGMLTPELEAQLEVQRTIVNQYEVQDQMSVLDPNSQEYIDLYKQNADYDRQIIMLSPNLTEEEKISYLAAYDESFNSNIEILELNRDISILNTELEGMEYGTEEYYAKENEIRELQINYYEGKTVLTPEEQQHLEFLRDGVELNELYIDKEQNNGFWHPFIESEYDEAILDKKIEMNIATEDEIAYDKMNGWERAWENTKTFTTSFAFGVGSVTESVVDGTVMLLGEGGKVLFNADTQWAEDFVSIHYADDAYTGLVLSDSINSVSAYSGWHTAGNVAGSTTGYVALSLLPGGKVTTAVTGGLSAMGSSSQRAFDYDASYHEAFNVGLISGTMGALAGYGVGGGITNGAQTLAQVGGKAFLGAGISALEPIVNSVAEYAMYANEVVDENGNKVYDNMWDYYVDGGGLLNTGMAFGAGFISSGIQSYKGYRTFKYKSEFNANMNAMSDTERSAAWEDYYRQKYGESVEHISGIDGNDPNLLWEVRTETTITSTEDFIEYAKKLGYSEESIQQYLKQIDSDLDWNFRKDLEAMDELYESLPTEMLSETGLTLEEWSMLTKSEKYQVLYSTFDTELYQAKKIRSLNDSADTLTQTMFESRSGTYTVDASEVIVRRMNAKNGIYTSSKTIVRNGIDYTNVFPGCDEIISDDALYKYIKDVTGLSDEQIYAYCDSIGVRPADNIEAMAYYLTNNEVSVKATIYQNAAPGAYNLVKFGSIGAENQIYEYILPDGSRQVKALNYETSTSQYYYYDYGAGKKIYIDSSDIVYTNRYNTSGGAYALLSSDEIMAQNFPDCCKLVDGKLVITDMEKFGKIALSGVPLSNAYGTYKITYEVPINSCSIPSVNNSSMYTDFGVPGGHLLSGELETVITGSNITDNLRPIIKDGELIYEYIDDFVKITDDGKLIRVEKIEGSK